jgi:hypothetical protein
MRLSEFGLAPQTVALPYAVWQVVTGLPENYINQVPDIDSYTIQVDVYATTATSARNVAKAIRDAIETKAHIVAWRGESKDPDTMHYRSSFDVTWFVPR